MPESGTYVTKHNPSIEDWLAFNEDYFSQLKSESSIDALYSPLVDVDVLAAELKISTEEYFEQVRKRVGSLGRAGLQLVHSEMDGAWHVIVAPIEATT